MEILRKYKDKLMHLLVCLTMYLVVVYLTGNELFAGFFAIFVGVLKEFWDGNHGGGFDQIDLLFDAVGTFIGFLIWRI